jgi:type VI secretion system secreted protein Hcp
MTVAFKMFLKLDDIAGEATDKQYKDFITVESFSFGVSNPPHVVGNGSNAGKATVQEMAISGPVQKSSPTLFLRCAQGSTIKTANLVVLKTTAQGTTEPFIKITLHDVLISSFTEGGQSASTHLPTDSFTLNFLKIDYTAGIKDTTAPAITWDIAQSATT